MTDREMLLQMWDEMWGSYTWIPGWAKSFADLTPQQAAWKPAGASSAQRNSIWQHLNHIAFWRETTVNRLANKPPSEDEMKRCNFEAPAEITDAAWRAAQDRLQKSHQAIRTSLADENVPVEKIRYLLPHDAYHLGQVMLLRALQGLPAVSYA